MNRQKGVTLIELLTVVVVVGILTSIALPSYNSYMRKTRRADAKVGLTSMAQQLERCYTRYYDYTNGGCGVVLPYNTPSGTYAIDADPAANPTPGIAVSSFALKATPLGKQALDTQCGTFTLNQANVRGVSGSVGVAGCW
jgi:type IV pilus assembly protein PilE